MEAVHPGAVMVELLFGFTALDGYVIAAKNLTMLTSKNQDIE